MSNRKHFGLRETREQSTLKQAAVQLTATLYPKGYAIREEAYNIRGMRAIQRTILEYGFDEVLAWDSAKFVRFRSSTTKAELIVRDTDLMRNIILRKLGGQRIRIIENY